MQNVGHTKRGMEVFLKKRIVNRIDLAVNRKSRRGTLIQNDLGSPVNRARKVVSREK